MNPYNSKAIEFSRDQVHLFFIIAVFNGFYINYSTFFFLNILLMNKKNINGNFGIIYDENADTG